MVEIDEKDQRVDIWVKHEKGIVVRCPECDEFYSVYDHSQERVYRHLNVCQMAAYIHVRLPRVNCPIHGVKQVFSNFGENGSDMTYEYEEFILNVSKECSIEAVGRLFFLSWDRCWNTVERAVARGQARKPHGIPKRIGVDEKSFARKHKYETIVTDLDNGTVKYICDDREQKSLEGYFKQYTKKELTAIEAIAMDMWKPFMAAAQAYIPNAEEKIVFERFHAMQYALKAVDDTRKAEHKELCEYNDERLKGTGYIWLWNQENVPDFRHGSPRNTTYRSTCACFWDIFSTKGVEDSI